MHQSQAILGRCIRRLREDQKISQEQLAERAGITYQYLSALENGRENFTIGVLESLASGLDLSFARLVAFAFAQKDAPDSPKVHPDHFRNVPLPGKLDITMIRDAIDETQRIIFQINQNLIAIGAKPLPSYIQGNKFSGLVSNLLCDSLSITSCFKHNSHQAYPDLVYHDEKTGREGLEIKATTQIGKGGESHNGHSGWHLIACYKLLPNTGNILFIHIMIAQLAGHNKKNSDWTHVGSSVNAKTGSRRTETYNPNLYGLTKLRDGSVYLDPPEIIHKNWRHKRRPGEIPAFSIFAATAGRVKKFSGLYT